MVQKQIVIIAQNDTDTAYTQGVYHVVNNILRSCGVQDKYQVFYQKNHPMVSALVNRGIYFAEQQKRYTQRGFYQINAEPIISGMLDYNDANPNRELLMVMRDSIYAQNLNYFLGVNSKRFSQRGLLSNATIISMGKNSPYAMDGLTFQSVLMHELGHRFGATDIWNRKKGELYDYPQLGRHCLTPGCIMNVTNSLRDGQVAAQRQATFCPGCMTAMKKELSR